MLHVKVLLGISLPVLSLLVLMAGIDPAVGAAINYEISKMGVRTPLLQAPGSHPAAPRLADQDRRSGSGLADHLQHSEADDKYPGYLGDVLAGYQPTWAARAARRSL
jgi:hypothetical protein